MTDAKTAELGVDVLVDVLLRSDGQMHPSWSHRAAERIQAQAKEIVELREALVPFAEFAGNVDDNGWTSNVHNEEISNWFGPSDFVAARAAFFREKSE